MDLRAPATEARIVAATADGVVVSTGALAAIVLRAADADVSRK
jgi:hypothetical protein